MPPLHKYMIEEAYKSLDKTSGWWVAMAGAGMAGVFCASGENVYQSLRGKAEAVVMYGSWVTDADLSDDVFRIRVSADAKRVKALELNELMFGAAYSLRGKPAPNLVLPTPDGQPMVLPQFKGSIVVLGFWGTWRPGDDAALPDKDNETKIAAALDALLAGKDLTRDEEVASPASAPAATN